MNFPFISFSTLTRTRYRSPMRATCRCSSGRKSRRSWGLSKDSGRMWELVARQYHSVAHFGMFPIWKDWGAMLVFVVCFSGGRTFVVRPEDLSRSREGSRVLKRRRIPDHFQIVRVCDRLDMENARVAQRNVGLPSVSLDNINTL